MTATASHTLVTDLTAWQPQDGEKPAIARLMAASGFTLVRLCFRAGQVLDDHRAGSAVIIQCLSGTVVVDLIEEADRESFTLTPGSAVHLEPRLTHRVAAETDAIVLLTVHRP